MRKIHRYNNIGGSKAGPLTCCAFHRPSLAQGSHLSFYFVPSLLDPIAQSLCLSHS